jgi:dihydroorotate dehydrogenase
MPVTPTLASAILPVLRRFEPERAHGLAVQALRWGLCGRAKWPDDPILSTDVFGLHFRNPIGLAAGFDKDAVAIMALARLGFGFVETGTVTPRPQPGNPRPRLFRLEGDRAIVNRMGFNSVGIEAFLRHLTATPRQRIPVGANLGINRDGACPERDYPALLAAVAPRADYVVVNVSSPNTPGLRDLQGEARIRAILEAIIRTTPVRPPLLVKLSPDLSEDGLAATVEVCVEMGIEGLIVSNTTTERPPGLRSEAASEVGGLSGAPLFAISTRTLARAFRLARGRLALVGAGGVFTGHEALIKIKAGASLVQLYTAFALKGPALVPRLKTELAAALRAEGFTRMEDAVGIDAAGLAGAA